MSKILATDAPAFVGGRAILWLRTAGREVAETAQARMAARASSGEANRDRDAGWLDSATGCEYVDDQIRRTE